MRRRSQDFLAIMLLFLLPLILFSRQTLGGRTLLPSENLYQYEPYATYGEMVRAPAVPHNHLLSDLVLQNMQWKAFIRHSIDAREIPLWNPHQFSGIPFMAAGQQSTLYPLSMLYYVMPLHAAYGWFTVLNLWLAGCFMLAFMRGLGVRTAGATISAITYQLCGFFLASAVFPMIIGAAVWLPLILLMIEFIIRRQPLLKQPSSVPWVVIGAGALACNIFAGHVELTIYTLLIAGFYAAGRLLWEAWRVYNGRAASLTDTVKSAGWLTGMIALGFGLGAIQFIPLFEFANTNWRAERSSLATVLGYAHPPRDALQFILPNFYGSPAHHSYFDIFSGETVRTLTNATGQPINYIDWGIKNYVESALYLGILPLALAAFALVTAWWPGADRSALKDKPPQRLIFALLGIIGLSFMFGLPTYAAVYILPGINQLNSPFRWIYAVTLSMAVLAGFGADALLDSRAGRAARRTGLVLVMGGALVLAGLLFSRVFFGQIEPSLQRIVENMEKAGEAFSGARMFYSFQFVNVAIFGVMTLLGGGVFWLAARHIKAWPILAMLLVAADLMIASWGFNPASDPALLDFTPPSIQWLLDRQDEEGPFRYATLHDSSQRNIMQANMTMRYGLDDIAGYDSIISLQYVNYMRQTSPQFGLDFNRIAPLYTDRLNEIDWTRLDLLNVRYLISHRTTTPPQSETQFTLAYEDEAVRIWRNDRALPRVYAAYTADNAPPSFEDGGSLNFTTGETATITRDTGRERLVDVRVEPDAAAWLIASETYAPGWRAFIRPQGAGDDAEHPLEVTLVLENFQGVDVSTTAVEAAFRDASGNLTPQQRNALESGLYTVRLVYSPTTFQVGLFGSLISGALALFLGGVWFWRLMVTPAAAHDSGVSRVARNSLAPIILNLFNRGIDFVFAFVMLRILGPEDAGIYYYAVVIFVWFDIFTNFGLDVFLIREAARQRDRAGYYFYNTTLLRLFLMIACVPLLIGFMLVRQATISPQLNHEALLALGLLYIGLAPGSLSKGLTSLFYAFERAEYPAAVATITTINKAVLGLGALLLGYGIVGLASVSIVVNIATLVILFLGARRLMTRPSRLRPDGGLLRGMMRESWPLMLNHFLATIFFQIDIIILEAVRGARIVGQYSVAYRWLLAINIIPAFFTQALLPVMSRQAQEQVDEGRPALRRTYTLAIKLLVSVALPLAVLFTFMAETLTWVLGGSEFLPDGAIALQLMIWSIPFGWINSLTQYALIAVNLQRRITQAFIIAVTFNITANLIFIPQYGYRAAAITTIFSEIVLLLGFGWLLQGALGRLNWLDMVWRPCAAAAVMLVVLIAGWSAQPALAVMIACLIYPVVLLALRPLSTIELGMVAPILPGRMRRIFIPES